MDTKQDPAPRGDALSPLALAVALLVIGGTVWGVNNLWGQKAAWVYVAVILLGAALVQRGAVVELNRVLNKAFSDKGAT